MPYAQQDIDPGAASDVVLITAPGANKKLSITSVYISSDTALIVTLESGTAALRWRQYVGANGGQNPGAVGSPERGRRATPLFDCAVNATLTVTTSAAGKVFVSVTYRIDRV